MKKFRGSLPLDTSQSMTYARTLVFFNTILDFPCAYSMNQKVFHAVGPRSWVTKFCRPGRNIKADVGIITIHTS